MTNSSEQETRLRIPRSDVQVRLQKQIDEGEYLIKMPIPDEHQFKLAEEAMESWYDYTKDLLLKLFSTDKMHREFIWSVRAFGMHLTFPQRVQEFHQHLDRRLNTLRSIVRRLELFEEDTQTGYNKS